MRDNTASNLVRSKTWAEMSEEIAHDQARGVSYDHSHQMNIAIKMGTLEPYRRHRAALDRLIWYDDPLRKTIIELGAGYGAMGTFWPSESTVFNVDLPEMLAFQKAYLLGLPFSDLRNGNLGNADYDIIELPGNVLIYLVPFTEADRLPFDGAYFFSTWALTETNFATWDYYIDKAPLLAGIYAVGWRGWVDIPDQYWPWEKLRDAFQTVRSDLTPYLDYDGAPTDSVELAAVNR